MKKEFKRLSKKTKLLLNHSEGFDVDFKRDLAGVKLKTLISFANSRSGGTVLVGVEEYTSEEGLQRGRIVGCDVSDKGRLQVQNKALSCVPPITIQVFTENLNKLPILRIEIPSGLQKPYCSPSGEYSIRADGRNRALQPGDMLQLFMERESEQFLQRFKHAVSKLEQQVGVMDSELRHGVDQMIDDITRLDKDTAHILNELYGRSMDLKRETEFSKRHDHHVERKIQRLKHGLDHKYRELAGRMDDLNLKVDALLRHLQIEDPICRRAREQIIDMALMIQERDNPDLLADFTDVIVQIYPHIERSKLIGWVNDALALPGSIVHDL
ncbi:helix-turn-helix domain-containing protein [Alkalimarinus sediminis]|uniref:ATP-binding protein n=1 Tax=Alkalimarinus sediminis TaxID=1632866 RepID=A0A9E8HM85_9ALTE|nr:ATP-binding protein [Alkalimarinus sediminis]UZW75243.1 ATP-binding protein [Alkalimarinus sediminis]